jgi:hypothetical protein
MPFVGDSQERGVVVFHMLLGFLFSAKPKKVN